MLEQYIGQINRLLCSGQ